LEIISNTETSIRFRPKPWRKETEAEAREQTLHAIRIEAHYRTHKNKEDTSKTLTELTQLFPELSFLEIYAALGDAARRLGRSLMSPFLTRLRELKAERKERRR
jgi:hypothetical protein